jgi:hypothetical protein
MANKMSNDAKLVNLVFPQGVYLRLYENFMCVFACLQLLHCMISIFKP